MSASNVPVGPTREPHASVETNVPVGSSIEDEGLYTSSSSDPKSPINSLIKKHPPRLKEIFPEYYPPLFFVTFTTFNRKPVLATEEVHREFKKYCHRGTDFGVQVGRYVIMPDHVHLFVRLTTNLSIWVRGLKRAITMTLNQERLWQHGFFDHLLRNSESYGQKWRYVFENPVRAGLVKSVDQWPFAGEIMEYQRV